MAICYKNDGKYAYKTHNKWNKEKKGSVEKCFLKCCLFYCTLAMKLGIIRYGKTGGKQMSITQKDN